MTDHALRQLERTPAPSDPAATARLAKGYLRAARPLDALAALAAADARTDDVRAVEDDAAVTLGQALTLLRPRLIVAAVAGPRRELETLGAGGAPPCVVTQVLEVARRPRRVTAARLRLHDEATGAVRREEPLEGRALAAELSWRACWLADDQGRLVEVPLDPAAPVRVTTSPATCVATLAIAVARDGPAPDGAPRPRYTPRCLRWEGHELEAQWLPHPDCGAVGVTLTPGRELVLSAPGVVEHPLASDVSWCRWTSDHRGLLVQRRTAPVSVVEAGGPRVPTFDDEAERLERWDA